MRPYSMDWREWPDLGQNDMTTADVVLLEPRFMEPIISPAILSICCFHAGGGEITFPPLPSPTSTPSQRHVAHYVDSCYDTICIFLCIHINHRYQAIMKRRNIPCLSEWAPVIMASS